MEESQYDNLKKMMNDSFLMEQMKEIDEIDDEMMNEIDKSFKEFQTNKNLDQAIANDNENESNDNEKDTNDTKNKNKKKSYRIANASIKKHKHIGSIKYTRKRPNNTGSGDDRDE